MSVDIKTYQSADFDYNLPNHLLASHPSKVRDKSRLLVVKANRDFNNSNYLSETLSLQDSYFDHLIDFIDSGDLLVFNDSKVIKARLFGNKLTGGKIEILVERILSSHEIIAHIRSNKTINLGLEIALPGSLQVKVVEKIDQLFRLRIENKGILESRSIISTLRANTENSINAIGKDFVTDFNLDIENFNWYSYLEKFGKIPLPPYIKRESDNNDIDDYQTVYAKYDGRYQTNAR